MAPRTDTAARPPVLRLMVLAMVVSLLCAAAGAHAQEPPAPQPISLEQLRAAIDQLGELDYDVRTSASRTIRRTPGAQAVPALLQAVQEHSDGYVRYRALVLLTGFNDPRTRGAMAEALSSPNDRLRTVAYSFFERSPDRLLATRLMASLETEHAEFVRPALVRALAAMSDIAAVRPVLVREAMRGEDFFRSAVIEALGDHKAAYAYDALAAITRLDGPLVDDAALAIGKLGDRRGLALLAGLQETAPKPAQPFVAAGICLLGANCDAHEGFLVETLEYADRNVGFQEALRGAAASLCALAVAGRQSALDALFSVGIESRDPTRAPVSLAVATVALRNTALTLNALAAHPRQSGAIALMAEGFDMLEEDLEKERFFAAVRRTYWASAESSPQRALMRTLIAQLDF